MKMHEKQQLFLFSCFLFCFFLGSHVVAPFLKIDLLLRYYH